MSEENASVSQNEASETLAPERDAETEALYASFDLKPAAEKKEIVFPGSEQQEKEEDKAPPAIEEAKTEPKKITVKYNKEDVEIDEDKIPEFVQKGLALDKERERRSELEKNLDRAAKLAGFKDHSEYVANFDRIEQQAQQQAVDQFEQAKKKIIDDLVYNGVDEAVAKEYAENNPLVQQAKAALEEKNIIQQQSQRQTEESQRLAEWSKLYDAFPEAGETAKLFADNGRPDWYTPEMESMVKQGYKPLDAYKLAHMDKIQTQSKKQMEQKLIKQQHLGTRAQVEGTSITQQEETTLLPAQAALAAEFGVSLDGVKNQMKSRR